MPKVKKNPTEYEIQKEYVKWRDNKAKRSKRYKYIFHVPNACYYSRNKQVLLKTLGVVAGVPDFMIPLARGKYNCAWLELKSKRGRVSPAQEEAITFLKRQKQKVMIARSIDEAIELTEGYLKDGT